MDRNLALEFVRITEAAAMACSRYMGRGDEKAADQAAVDAMRVFFDTIPVNGTIVIGEGERDEAPMLFIGEKVGRATSDAPEVDIALDPLEGTTICAQGGVGALSVIAVAPKGMLLHAPDTYMDKIAAGPKARGVINIDRSPRDIIYAVAEALGKKVSDMTVVILHRPRHEGLIQEVRDIGARIHLISDGDISVALATSFYDTGIDLLLGVGGAPEGVIAAAALKCLGGDFQGRLMFRNNEERERARRMGVTDLDKSYGIDDIARGDVMFCATGVTTGPLLKGVRFLPDRRVATQSVVMRSRTGTVRTIDAVHCLDFKPIDL